ESLKAILDVLEKFVAVFNQVSQIHPIASAAWKVVHGLYAIPKAQLERDEQVTKLICTIGDVYSSVRALDDVKKAKGLEDTIEKILQATIECTSFIQKYTRDGFGGEQLARLVHQTFSTTSAKIKKFETRFRDLKEAFRDNVIVQVALVTSHTAGHVELLHLKHHLSPVNMGAFNQRPCHIGTRSFEIMSITNWVNAPVDGCKLLWLPGPPGFGKSTLSVTLAHNFAKARRLGASLFFNRDVQDRSDPAVVILSLAYQLALFDHRIAKYLFDAISERPSIPNSHGLNQFSELIVKPLTSLTMLGDDGPLLIILDALDECGDERTRRTLLTILAKESQHLPSYVRVVITSRPNDDIVRAFEHQPHVQRRDLEITRDNTADVEVFLRYSLGEVAAERRLRSDWPSEELISLLISSAGGLFIWAETVINGVRDSADPTTHLTDLMKEPIDSLPQLYATTLQTCGTWDDDAFRRDFFQIFGAILIAKRPLSPKTIDGLLSRSSDGPLSTSQMASQFRAVLYIDSKGAVRTIHPSFYDFLSDQTHFNGTWSINLDVQNRDFALHCIEFLDRELKENLCGLVHSLEPTTATLPEGLSYACIFWIQHAATVTDGAVALGDRIHEFFQQHAIHWLEAVSILAQTRQAIALLKKLMDWADVSVTQSHALNDGFRALIWDSWRFCQYFADIIEEHPLAVYHVALPFAPQNSLMYQKFHREDTMPKVVSDYCTLWPSLLLSLTGHVHSVTSIAISPDGSRIASGSRDHTIRVWDAATGALVLGPLDGYEVITHVAFSPDGARIVSCSRGPDIFLQDATSGSLILGPLQGHRSQVACVAFSPDGSKIVSWALDETTCVWDLITGVPILGPLVGYKGHILSLALSADGARIISGGLDGTIRIWDAAALTKFEDDHLWVHAVAFSPDGPRIVASAGETIDVIDALTGAVVVGPLSSGQIELATFSPDGLLLGTTDDLEQCCIWDTTTGASIFTLESSVGRYCRRKVIFSPDGSRFTISRSPICIWDSRTGAVIARPQQRGDERSNSVVFSPDGSRLAFSPSGGVLICDSSNGAIILGPLGGVNGPCWRMAFSADGFRLCTLSLNRLVEIWDTATG
ncbi:hypothetical protein BOTBODRAFT_77629, partial [Botryobasidium botryosum FD-172 SS1]